MQFNWSIISKKIYGILKGSCESLVMYDAKGNETIDPDEATRFFAAFKSSNPELDDFTILVAVHDEGNRSYIDIKTPELEDDADFNKVNSIRNSIRKSIGEREGIKINWQVFDHAIDPREEAVHNIKESKIKKAVDKLEEEFNDLIESKDVSGIYGSTKSSFQKIGDAKLIVRHSASVNEEKRGARSRNIKAIFVENRDGERFKYPHLHVSGARAFARHISNGGTNHDDVSKKIFSISENYLHLRRSGSKLRLIEGVDPTWIPAIRESMNKINKQLKSMHGPKGYSTALTSILEENSIDDVSAITDLCSEIMEKCGFDSESPYAKDIEVAAKYIVERRLDPKPINFAWNSKLNFETRLTEFTKVSERLTWQLNELAAACTDQIAMSKLASIAEMISNGVMPNADDMGIIKQAFESHDSYIHEDKGIPEEHELNEFLDDFTVESTFSEEKEEKVKCKKCGKMFVPTYGEYSRCPSCLGKEHDHAEQATKVQEELVDEGSRIVQKFTDPSGRSAIVYKDSDFNEFKVKFYIDGVYQKNADYYTTDKNDATGTAELFVTHQHTIKPHVSEGPEDFDDTLDDDFEDDGEVSSLMRNYHGMVKDEFNNEVDETRYESSLTDEMPREIFGVVGAESKRFKRRFKNQAQQDAWFEKNGGYDNFEIHTIQRIDGLSEDQMSNDGFGPLYHAQRLFQKEINNPHMRLSDLPKEKQDEYIERVINGERSNHKVRWDSEKREYYFAEDDVDAGRKTDAEIDAFGMTESPENKKSNIKVINGVTIHTSFDHPPIPNRGLDWSAVTDNYDGAPDAAAHDSVVGHGRTEDEAVEDLLNRLSELDEASNDQDIQMDIHNDQDTAAADAETNGNQFSESSIIDRIKKLSGL